MQVIDIASCSVWSCSARLLQAPDLPGDKGPQILVEQWSAAVQCSEIIVMLRQLSYVIKNQLKAPKAP